MAQRSDNRPPGSAPLTRAGGRPRFLIQARIDRAQRLLTETGRTVTQVASTVGDTDVAYFSRPYKLHTGRSPRSAR
jgi:transcriptional regulator GlxA family with amidase domain